MELSVTKKQFENILGFLSIFGDSDEILKQSPDYILEKVGRHIVPPDLIYDGDVSGIHFVLRQGVVERYVQIWKPEFKKRVPS